ncbi:MAG: Two component transcriptional regulator, winged helix family [Candidatus Saccharibacteria bacterium GW2011_GWC2_48_9]|nr:MAG: Two component transcriptional regulator, winged helix family [Candidatus Saccharibacteria bacterium GW2011_GWC2_48_9]
MNEGYAVDLEYDGEAGYLAASAGEYDLILLDVMLPKRNGIEVCTQLRGDEDHTPIVMLTAKDQPEDIVRGLDHGADDYIAKPFSFEVLLARVRAILRRPHDKLSEILTVDDLELDTTNRSVRRGDQEILLTSKEFSILEYMLRSKNRVVSKNSIMTHVWDFDADILPNNVEVFVNYIRNKVDKPFSGRNLIQTMRGFGYIIKDEG